MLIAHLALPVLLLQTAKLDIKDTVVGTGTQAQVGDVVSVDYTGKLTDGKQFDSSVGKQPFTFQLGVGQVIKGWDQGVVGMKEGGVRDLTIPAELGYGARGAGDAIPPNATLNFNVKLLKVMPRDEITVQKEGTGEGAKVGDTLEVNYRLSVDGGKEIDSSYKRNTPARVQIAAPPPGQRGIFGITQALIGMKQGEKRKAVIPSELAFGKDAVPPQDVTNPQTKEVIKAGSIIPANAKLTFEVELVKLTPAAGEAK